MLHRSHPRGAVVATHEDFGDIARILGDIRESQRSPRARSRLPGVDDQGGAAAILHRRGNRCDRRLACTRFSPAASTSGPAQHPGPGFSGISVEFRGDPRSRPRRERNTYIDLGKAGEATVGPHYPEVVGCREHGSRAESVPVDSRDRRYSKLRRRARKNAIYNADRTRWPNVACSKPSTCRRQAQEGRITQSRNTFIALPVRARHSSYRVVTVL